MPWSGDQLPWNVPFSKPPRPSDQWEPLNWMKGPGTLIRGGGFCTFGGPPVMLGGRISISPGRPPIMLGTGFIPNLYRAPSVLSSTGAALYGAPTILAGVRIRGGSKK